MAKDPKKYAEMYEGTRYQTSTGEWFTIEKYVSSSEVYIRFDDAPFQLFKITSYKNIISGTVSFPFKTNKDNGSIRPYCFGGRDLESMKKQYIGNVYRTHDNSLAEIISYIDAKHVAIRFLNTDNIITVAARNLEKGEVKNPYAKNTLGGYTGGSTIYNSNEYKWLYTIWYNILMRTNPDASAKYKKFQNFSVYNGTTICEEWKNYNTFAYWYMTNLEKLNPKYRYDVEKDCLCRVLMLPKMYSPRTCELVPHELNLNLICRAEKSRYNTLESFNKYKAEKEQTIHELADKYYAEGALTDRGYYALKNYCIYYKDLV